MIVTGRDFRANQSKYIGIAHSGEDVILKSRAGSVKLIPVDTTEVTKQNHGTNKAYIKATMKYKAKKQCSKNIVKFYLILTTLFLFL